MLHKAFTGEWSDETPQHKLEALRFILVRRDSIFGKIKGEEKGIRITDRAILVVTNRGLK